MAQEQDRDIHLPQPGAAPGAQHPKTAPRALPSGGTVRLEVNHVDAALPQGIEPGSRAGRVLRDHMRLGLSPF